jgi:type IX secretion system PorP/SprF family membrane protein
MDDIFKFSMLKSLRAQIAFGLAACLLGISPGNVTAQDLHFSQFMHNPLLTNPANTGFNPDNDYRLGASYRNQWWGLPVPYKTMSVWGDVQIMRDNFYSGWLGVGGALLRDVAGSGNLTSTKGYASVAWHQELGVNSLVSAGFNLGYASKRIDLQSFTWENQWNGKFFDSNIPSGERFAYSQIGYFDLQAGLNYAWFPSDNVYLNGGASIMHVNNPRESFFADSVSNNKVPQRYTGFLNGAIKLNDQWIINPNVYYSYQAGSSEIVGGMMAQYNLSDYGAKQVLGGVYYRGGDAAIAMLGLEWSDVRLTFTYDATTSNVRNFNNANGAIEFSIIKFGAFSTSTPRQSRCPSF